MSRESKMADHGGTYRRPVHYGEVVHSAKIHESISNELADQQDLAAPKGMELAKKMLKKKNKL